MAAGATYEPIATTTLATAGTDITFSSIAASWTDIRLVVTVIPSGVIYAGVQFNSDTSTNYSQTILTGEGTTAESRRYTSQTYLQIDDSRAYVSGVTALATVDIFSYAGSTNKTCLISNSNDRNGSGTVNRIVGLWRSTSAITSVKFYSTGANFAVGTTATLYGIKAA